MVASILMWVLLAQPFDAAAPEPNVHRAPPTIPAIVTALDAVPISALIPETVYPAPMVSHHHNTVSVTVCGIKAVHAPLSLGTRDFRDQRFDGRQHQNSLDYTMRRIGLYDMRRGGNP